MHSENECTMRYNPLKHIILIIVTAVLAVGCATTKDPNVERGTDYQYREGYPELRIAAIGLLDENDNALINVTAEVVYGSLIYVTDNDVSKANVVLEIRASQVDGSASYQFREAYEISMEPGTHQMNQDVFTIIEDLEVEPGEYDVNFSLTDLASDKTVNRRTSAQIPDPESPVVNLTTVRLSAKDLDSNEAIFVPITTYNVPSRVDSLKFDFQVTNNDVDEPLTVETRLLKFRADSTPASPMHFNNYSPSSIQYRGIDYRDEEEIDSNVRLLDDPGSVLIEFKYATLERGNYRFEVEIIDQDGETQYRARDFSIKSENFPNLFTPRELAEPLAYLMNRREYERLMEIQDPDSLKEAIDRFWLTNVGSQSRAKSVINLYYDRVEQANKYFTNFKEGWKTDMGMMYILFGPPWYVDSRLNSVRWSYSYNSADPYYNFYFERTRTPNRYYPFDNYLLQRSGDYFNRQYQQVQLWLTGLILNRNR